MEAIRLGRTRSLNDAMEKYKASGNNDFFFLKEDKEAAVVRFLHTNEDDLDWYVVHAIEIGGKKRYVQCTEEGDCPLCASGNRPIIKIFIQLVDSRDGKTKTWERGQNFVPKVLGLINRYGDLNNRPYEVERNGKKGDTATTYETYPLEKDGKEVNLPERQTLLGENGFVLQKSHLEMTQILNGTYVYEPVQNPPAGTQAPPQQRQQSQQQYQNPGGPFNQQNYQQPPPPQEAPPQQQYQQQYQAPPAPPQQQQQQQYQAPPQQQQYQAPPQEAPPQEAPPAQEQRRKAPPAGGSDIF